MVTTEFLDNAFQHIDLNVDLDSLCKLYGQILSYTNATADLTYLETFQAVYGDEIIKCVESKNNTRYQRLKRFRKYVQWCLTTDGYCLFVTLTFDDDMLSKSFKYRKEKVSAFLKSCSPYYLANIDFGKERDREHYHALLYFPYEKAYQGFLTRCDVKAKGIYISKDWKYWNEFIPCKNEKDDISRLAKYITKLSSHAFKDTTESNRYRTIYSDAITTLNRLVNESKRNPLFVTDELAQQDLIRGVVVRSKAYTNVVRTKDGLVYCSDLKEAHLKDLMFKYQWKPFNDTYKPCNSDIEYIDADGTLISLDDLPF